MCSRAVSGAQESVLAFLEDGELTVDDIRALLTVRNIQPFRFVSSTWTA